jgi:CheY-like chemotaxis protein
MLRALLPATIEMRLDLRAGDSKILGDGTQIHQVLMNLCTNAAQAMEPAGGRLEIRMERLDGAAGGLPEGASLKAQPYVRLQVRDTGPGIAPEHLDRIFEPYFTTKGVGKGTGLGLAVVHGIVESHGGRVVARPQTPTGMCFEVYLPALAPAAEAPAAARPAGPEGGRESLLLVDDEPALARMQQQMLERLGYRVTTRTSSLEALEAFKAVPHRYDAVITDMTMPGLTGDQLAVELRRVRPEIPILICTGFSERLAEAEARALGIDAFLMKPVGLAELAGALRCILGRRSSAGHPPPSSR